MANDGIKISKVEAFHVVWQPNQRSAWVRIWTEDGQYGLGEASPMAHGSASLQIIQSSLAPMLVGQNALDSKVLQDRMFHAHIKLGPDGALAAALAAVDIALWDLKGKLLGQPIYQLLGGAWTRDLPFYASIGGNAERSVEQTVQVVADWMKMKPAQVKIRFDGDKTRRDVDLPGDIAKARAVRQLVGSDFPLAFDANNGYSVQGAIRVGRVLEELGFVWFEEPVQSYQIDSFGEVARALDIAVAAGEQEYTLQGVKRLIEAGVDIVQPDIVKTGGFSGLMDMLALARAFGVDFVPHQTQPGVGQRASLHFAAAQLHRHYPCEYADKSSRQAVLFAQPTGMVDGLFHLSDAPGLGLEIVEDELEQRIIPFH